MQNRSELDRLCNRFEIAADNFIRSTISLKSNEKSFQAWFSSFVIQEFGVARTYRELHLRKHFFRQLITKRDFGFDLIQAGNQIFPDICISWEPNVDTRHSRTREGHLKEGAGILNQFSIIAELKITGSTSKPTPIAEIVYDCKKLGVINHLHIKAGNKKPLATYMVILDNNESKGGYMAKEKVEKIRLQLKEDWEKKVPYPKLIIGRYGFQTEVVPI